MPSCLPRSTQLIVSLTCISLISIPAEGVVGHVDLELADYVWHAVDANVVEQ